MEKINIQIPEGYQIDLEKSDLSTGQIIFKKVEKKKPLKFEDLEEIEGYYVDSYSDIRQHDLPLESDVDINVFPQKDQCEAVLALSQLLQLHKAWKEFDTEPENLVWWVSFYYDNSPTILNARSDFHRVGVFKFNNLKLATEFKDTFINLFEKLKPITFS